MEARQRGCNTRAMLKGTDVGSVVKSKTADIRPPSGITASVPPSSEALSARHLVLSSRSCCSRGDHGRYSRVSALVWEEHGRSVML